MTVLWVKEANFHVLDAARVVAGNSIAPWLQGIESSPVGWIGFLGQGVKDTIAYRSCMATQAANCDQQNPGWQDLPSDDPVRIAYETCLQGADLTCQAQAAAGTAPLSAADVTSLQTRINAALASQKICPIGVDGKLGPTTCHAAVYVSSYIDSSVTVPSQCDAILARSASSGFNPDCKTGPQGPPPPECSDTSPCPDATKECVNGKCVDKCPSGYNRSSDGSCVQAVAKATSASAWGLALLGGGAAAAIFFGLRAPKMTAADRRHAARRR